MAARLVYAVGRRDAGGGYCCGVVNRFGSIACETRGFTWNFPDPALLACHGFTRSNTDTRPIEARAQHTVTAARLCGLCKLNFIIFERVTYHIVSNCGRWISIIVIKCYASFAADLAQASVAVDVGIDQPVAV